MPRGHICRRPGVACAQRTYCRQGTAASGGTKWRGEEKLPALESICSMPAKHACCATGLIWAELWGTGHESSSPHSSVAALPPPSSSPGSIFAWPAWSARLSRSTRLQQGLQPAAPSQQDSLTRRSDRSQRQQTPAEALPACLLGLPPAQAALKLERRSRSRTGPQAARWQEQRSPLSASRHTGRHW